MGQYLQLITKDYMEGVSEPWCNNQGVAVLPFVYKHNNYWFLVINEHNPLFADAAVSPHGTLTGGCDKNISLEMTVKNEILEETGININNKKVPIYGLGHHYANKTSIKKCHLYGVDLTNLNLDLQATYYGTGDGSSGEEGISACFINEKELEKINDILALAIYAKLYLHKIIINYQQSI